MKKKIRFTIEGTYEIDLEHYPTMSEDEPAVAFVNFDSEFPEFWEFAQWNVTSGVFVTDE